MDVGMHLRCLEAGADRFVSTLSAGMTAGSVSGAGCLGVEVPTCPGWRVRDLVEHVGGLYRWSAVLVGEGVVVETWRRDLEVVYPGGDAEVVDWFAESVAVMAEAFRRVPGDAPVWAWGADPHARFWPRRMLHETAVHLVDLDLALGRVPVVDAAVAVDGIDEFVTNLASTARWGAPVDRLRGGGEVLVVEPVDVADRWRFRFEPTGLWWDRGGEGGDAVVRGPVADLYLFLQGRRRPGVVVDGEVSVLERWFSALDF